MIRSNPVSALLVVLSLAVGVGGCAFRTPTPHVPAAIAGTARGPARLDVSSVEVVARSGAIDPETAATVRARVEKILADAARKSSTGDGPAEVRVRVELGEYEDYADRAMRRDGIAVFAYLLMAPAGVTFDRQELSVEVTIERGGQTMSGRGVADRRGSIYAPARKRALAVALDRALANAAESAALR